MPQLLDRIKNFATYNRLHPTKAERLCRHLICKNKLTGVRFLRQYIIYPYILDFYCPKLKLGIELDGSSHENQEEDDWQRQKDLNKWGIKIIRYSNELVETKLEGVYEDICREITERRNELGERK